MNKIILGDGGKRYCERYSETMGICGCGSHYDIFTETETPFSNRSTTHDHEAAAEAFPLVYKGYQGFLFPPIPFPFVSSPFSPFLIYLHSSSSCF